MRTFKIQSDTNWIKLLYKHQDRELRFIRHVERLDEEYECPACDGKGDHGGDGIWEPIEYCGYCEGLGLVIPEMIEQWQRWMEWEKKYII